MREEFISELENNGVTDIDYCAQIGPEKKDSLSFRINDKVFIIDSGRGGSILKGSYLVCDVIDDRKHT